MITVKVNTLKMGDKFVLESYSVEFPYVYVVIDVHPDGCSVDCVCIDSGKEFTFGGSYLVVPVNVKLKVIGAVKAKSPTDLTNKCGGCIYASSEDKVYYRNVDSYIKCTHPEKHWKNRVSPYRARTTRCCSKYKAKET